MMLSFHHNSDTIIVVLHEIYGINDHMRNFCLGLFQKGFDVICPNLLGIDKPFHYREAEIAYRHFVDHVGFDGASTCVRSLLTEVRSKYKYQFIIGFSVGATVAWLCSEQEKCVDGMIGYYGSRIRDYLDVNPTIPVLLIFPSSERSFNVQDLFNTLSSRRNIIINQYPGEHGFCDPGSDYYCHESCHHAYSSMLKFINFLRSIEKNRQE